MKGQKFKASLVKFDSCKKTKELYNNLLRKKKMIKTKKSQIALGFLNQSNKYSVIIFFYFSIVLAALFAFALNALETLTSFFLSES